jgi:ATP-dependent RNA helicase DDX55/SPB4
MFPAMAAIPKSTCSTTFSELKPALSEATLQVLTAQGFERTTPVQASTIPLFLSNKDVAVEAVTGSGKTLAFVVPLIEMLRKLEAPLRRHQVGAIIISPTRELAQQIHAVALPYVETVRGLKAVLLVGGTDVGADVRRLKEEGANVLIGTPGRLNDIMERSAAMDLKRLEVKWGV